MWHPWRELRALTDTIFAIDDGLPSGDGWYSPEHDVVLMRPGLLQVQRRCVLAHELGHRTLGHSGTCWGPDAGRLGVRMEAAADLWAAHKLIEIRDLVDAGRWARDRREAADELWVTEHLLTVRLRNIHVSERGLLYREGITL